MDTTIAGITFPNPIFNAAGVCGTTKEELQLLASTGTGGLWTKTLTLMPREGNQQPRVFCLGTNADTLTSGNSVGLANGGIEEMLQIVGELDAHQPIVLSIGGADKFDIIQMIELAKDNEHVDAIEINISCPNLEDGTGQLAFNFEELEDMLDLIKITDVKKPIGLKLPYYQDKRHFDEVVRIIDKVTPLVRFITCINGMSGMLLDPQTNKTRTIANHGITGMGGTLLFPFALGNIATFYRLFKEKQMDIDIIGCGGVTCVKAIWQMIWVGAKGVQMGTKILAAHDKPESDQVLTELWTESILELYDNFDKYGEFTSVAEACGGFHEDQNLNHDSEGQGPDTNEILAGQVEIEKDRNWNPDIVEILAGQVEIEKDRNWNPDIVERPEAELRTGSHDGQVE